MRGIPYKYFEKYINKSTNFCVKDLLSFFIPFFPFNSRVSKKEIYDTQLSSKSKENSDRKIKLSIEPYNGNNTYVLKMIKYLKNNLYKDLFGVYVHGSLGTYEETAYSDFDALAIIKNEVFKSSKRLAKVAQRLSAARRIMFELDPLQHHGWFVLTEADFYNYPDYYFPFELFNYSKSLFSDKGLTLNIRIKNSQKEKKIEIFDSISLSIIKTVCEKKYPINAYELKGLLSKFMLLPSLYIQARDGKSIFKKFSFGEAKKDFLEHDWRIMDEVSEIRKNWQIKIFTFQKILLTSPCQIFRYFGQKWGPKVPDETRKLLTPDFYQRMKKLVLIMRKNLEPALLARRKNSL